MKAELIIAILSLICSSIIGFIQIRLAKKQKSIKKDIEEIEIKISQKNQNYGIIGNKDTNINGVNMTITKQTH